MLAGMLLFVILGQLLTLDMSLTFYLTVALCAFLAAQRSAEEGSSPRGWMLLAWAATGLGMLTKGLVAAAIPGAVLVLYSAYTRDFKPWRRLHAAAGVPLFLAITAPWYALAARRIPDFLEFFFVHEHFARYLTPSADRQEVWWFFGAVFLLGSLPWTLSALRVLFLDWPRPAARGDFDAALFLQDLGVVRVRVLFAVRLQADSVHPARDAGARARDRLAARGLSPARSVTHGARYGGARDRPRAGLPVRTGSCRPDGAQRLLSRRCGGRWPRSPHCSPYRACTFCPDGAAKRRVEPCSWGPAGAWPGLLAMRAASAVAPIYSGVTLARAFPGMPREAPLYSVATYDQTLPFYWRRTVELVAFRGELDYGLKRDPGAEIPTVDEFVQRWTAGSNAFAIMEKPMFEELSRRQSADA